MNLKEVARAPIYTKATETRSGTCRDVLLNMKSGQIVAFLANTGAALAPQMALIAPEHLSLKGDELWTDLEPKALVDQEKTAPESDTDQIIDLVATPPLMVGPFGSTFPPTMAAALVNHVLGAQEPNRPPVASRADNLYWLSDMLGLPVFDSSRELGILEDMVAGPELSQCTELLLDDAQAGMRSVPFASIRSIPKTVDSIIVELRAVPPYSAEGIARASG